MNSLTEYLLSPSPRPEPLFDRPIALLKRCLRRVAVMLVSSDYLWKPMAKTLVRGSQYLCSVRDLVEVQNLINETPQLRQAFAERVVIAGPFEGLHYGETRACCSALYPKLLGTYEHEISGFIESSLAARHELIVDVGAADGYYAVGFAVKSAGTQVIAFEQDDRARTELRKLAKLNGVVDRVQIQGKCEPGDLLALPSNRGLMIMDCEGFEEQLLLPEVIDHLKDWDFVVETHDGFSTSITERLANRFSKTHVTACFEVVHDLNKADHIDIPLLSGIPRKAVDKLVAENRMHACLRWIVCTPRCLETQAIP